MVRSADFAATLGTGIARRTPHFALHHRPAAGLAPEKISTDPVESAGQAVDDSPASGQAWLGMVVPKRHARRAVTRSLLKRQIRETARRHAPSIGPGLWIVRLRAPFDRTAFPAAASTALKRAARAELEQLLGPAAGARRGDR